MPPTPQNPDPNKLPNQLLSALFQNAVVQQEAPQNPSSAVSQQPALSTPTSPVPALQPSSNDRRTDLERRIAQSDPLSNDTPRSTTFLGGLYINHPNDGDNITSNSVRFVQVGTGQMMVRYLFGEAKKAVGPGVYLVVSPFGFGQSGRIVDMRLHTLHISADEMGKIVCGGIELQGVSAALDFQVIDPIKALTEATNYGTTLIQVGRDMTRSKINPYNIEDLARRRGELTSPSSNFAPDVDEKGYIRDPELRKQYGALEKMGVSIRRLSLKSIDFPDGLEREIARADLARLSAAGEIAEAAAEVAVASHYAAAAAQYDTKALRLRELQVYEKFATGPGNTFIGTSLPTLTNAVAGLAAPFQTQNAPEVYEIPLTPRLAEITARIRSRKST